MRPASGTSRPQSRRSSVDLPDPVCPMIAVDVPGATSSETSSSARARPLYEKDACSTCKLGTVPNSHTFLMCCGRLSIKLFCELGTVPNSQRLSTRCCSLQVQGRPRRCERRAANGTSRPRSSSSAPCAKTSSGVPSRTMCPWSRTITRSASTASSMKWVTCTSVVPALASRPITRRMADRPRTSSSDPGSSSTSTSGSMASAPAMATRCFCPPERREGSAAA